MEEARTYISLQRESVFLDSKSPVLGGRTHPERPANYGRGLCDHLINPCSANRKSPEDLSHLRDLQKTLRENAGYIEKATFCDIYHQFFYSICAIGVSSWW